MAARRFSLFLALCAVIHLAGGCSPSPSPVSTPWAVLRQRMVDEQLVSRGIKDQRVLEAMGRVPRHEFVAENLRFDAYGDYPLPIGEGQTISQPYIVAFMTELAEPEPQDRVLEVGTGSGYQAAVIAELVSEVYSIELLPSLAESARARLVRLGYERVQVQAGDGYLGWPDKAPFDAILVTCGADHVPEPLFEQLKPGGKLIIPVGPRAHQVLQVVEKGEGGERLVYDRLPVRFVPLLRKEYSSRGSPLEVVLALREAKIGRTWSSLMINVC